MKILKETKPKKIELTASQLAAIFIHLFTGREPNKAGVEEFTKKVNYILEKYE